MIKMAHTSRPFQQRPQDYNRSLKRHQIRVNLGPSQLSLPNNYESDVQKAISEQKPIIPKVVDTEDLYFDGSAIEVMNQQIFTKMLAVIEAEKLISIDYEFHTEDAFNGFVSVISVGTWDKTYVVDPIYELWNSVNGIFKPSVLENSSILKIFFNMDNDVLLGQTTFGAFMKGVVDLQHMYAIYKRNSPNECFNLMKQAFEDGERDKSKQKKSKAELNDWTIKLKWQQCEKVSYEKMVHSFYGKKTNINKKLRLSDWRTRPLGELVDYAAKDSFYLLGIFHILLSKIGHEGLIEAMEAGKKELFLKAKIRAHKRVEKLPEAVTLDFDQLSNLQRIYNWRLQLAKRTDKNPMKIISDSKLIELAKKPLTSNEEMAKFIEKINHPSQELVKQKSMLMAYLNNDLTTIEKKENAICHNCNIEGHLAFECGEEPNAAARSAFLNRPENRDKKQKQRERKDRRYAENLEKRKLN